MNQLTLLLDEPRARSRARDPITSKLAAAAAKDLQRAHCDEILAALRKFGALGKDGLAARTRMDGTAIARRLPEMERAGLVAPTGRTVMSTAGRVEREWAVR
ncbi:MAG: hypothetical protein V4792_09840 [Pseudomonadota bacterium]